jgi:hypothetical protein
MHQLTVKLPAAGGSRSAAGLYPVTLRRSPAA